jgi:hypothetical protein
MAKKILALLLAAVLAAGLLAGCGASSGTPVQAAAFSTGDTLALAVSAELNNGDFVSYGGYQFQTTKKLADMADLITKKNEGVTAEAVESAYGTCYLFTKDAGTVKDTWCLYQQDPANIQNWYIFVGTHRKVNLGNEDLDILLPLQYVSDSYLRDSMANRVEPDTPYACNLKDAGQDVAALFKDFYETSGMYSVTDGENGGFTIAALQGDATPLTFTFESSSGGSYFTVTPPVTDEDTQPDVSATVVWSGAQTGEPAAIAGTDAQLLQSALTGLSYGSGTAAESYDYKVTIDGTEYEVSVLWAENAWSGSAQTKDGAADLTARQAASLAAVFGGNKLIAAAGGKESWPSSIDATLTEAAACMKVTANVNVRSAPDKTGEVLSTMPSGSLAAVTGSTSNGWYEVLYGQKLAYMSADYLTAADGE